MIEDIEGVTITKEHFPFFKEISYKGREVVFLDLHDLKPEKTLEYVPQTENIVRNKPQDSILFLTDFTGMTYSKESLILAKDYTVKNKPYVIKSALVGVTGLQSIALKAMIQASGRKNLAPFKELQEALEWLVS